jgi:transitional endoplasmic reticulum ATPase
VVRKNLNVKLGDIVTIHSFSDLKFGKRIHVLPFEDTALDIKKNLFDDFLKPYFLDSYRPIKKGDSFKIKSEENFVEFKVVEIDPVDYCIVGPDTIIYCEGEPLQREKQTEDFMTTMKAVRYLLQLKTTSWASKFLSAFLFC